MISRVGHASLQNLEKLGCHANQIRGHCPHAGTNQEGAMQDSSINPVSSDSWSSMSSAALVMLFDHRSFWWAARAICERLRLGIDPIDLECWVSKHKLFIHCEAIRPSLNDSETYTAVELLSRREAICWGEKHGAINGSSKFSTQINSKLQRLKTSREI